VTKSKIRKSCQWVTLFCLVLCTSVNISLFWVNSKLKILLLVNWTHKYRNTKKKIKLKRTTTSCMSYIFGASCLKIELPHFTEFFISWQNQKQKPEDGHVDRPKRVAWSAINFIWKIVISCVGLYTSIYIYTYILLYLLRVKCRWLCVRKQNVQHSLLLPYNFPNTASISVSTAQSYIPTCHCYQS
jgi:hypothetical protein